MYSPHLSIVGQLTKHVPDITVSNGIDWSPDNKTMYYIDSVPKKVYAFDYHELEGTVSNQRVFVDYAQASNQQID